VVCGGQGGSSGGTPAWLLSEWVTGTWTPARELAVRVAIAVAARPAASEAGTTLHGGVLGLGRTRFCGCGASGSEGAESGVGSCPAAACARAGTNGIGRVIKARSTAADNDARR
ncbi:MAG: hypothetical protein WB608_12195, partial [Terracidiphilus sp.]